MSTKHLEDALQTFLTIESIAAKPSQLRRAINFVADYIASQDPRVTIERFSKNGKPSILAYKGAARPKNFAVLLNGHVDVVPGTPKQFKPKAQGDKLYGRGTLDMKGAVLVMSDVFCKLSQVSAYPLGLQIVSDEEIGGANGTKYQIEQGVQADMVICGEYSPYASICNESRGICQAQVTFRGKTAHSAYPWDGVNAAVCASEYITKLLARYPVPTTQSWVTTANVSSINTPSTTINRVPDSATIQLDIRYVPADKTFARMESATAFLRSITTAEKEIAISMFEPAHFVEQTHPLVKQLATALSKTTGKKTIFVQKPGAADARFYSSLGTPAPILGLQGEGLHGDNEYVELSSLASYHQTLTTFLNTLKI